MDWNFLIKHTTLKALVQNYYFQIWINEYKRGLTGEQRDFLDVWSSFLLKKELPEWSQSSKKLESERVSFKSDYIFRTYALFWALTNNMDSNQIILKNVAGLNKEITVYNEALRAKKKTMEESMQTCKTFTEKILENPDEVAQEDKEYFFTFYNQAVTIDLRNLLMLVSFNYQPPVGGEIGAMPSASSLHQTAELFLEKGGEDLCHII